jgi:hypothetical protein
MGIETATCAFTKPVCMHGCLIGRCSSAIRRRIGNEPSRRRMASCSRSGSGSGLNLPLYSVDVIRVYAIDPSAQLLKLAETRRNAVIDTMLVRASAEALPFRDESVDTVVTTWTLCTIPDPFKIDRMETGYMRGVNPFAYMYEGAASVGG